MRVDLVLMQFVVVVVLWVLVFVVVAMVHAQVQRVRVSWMKTLVFVMRMYVMQSKTKESVDGYYELTSVFTICDVNQLCIGCCCYLP